MLTKEQCEEALSSIEFTMHKRVKPKYLGHCEDDNLNILWELIEEHFDNPPLKWEELKEGMWIWDSKECEYIFIDRLWISDSNKKMMIYKGLESQVKSEFIEDRFYRKEVQE